MKILLPGVKVLPVEAAVEMKDQIDVMILCGGSRKTCRCRRPGSPHFNVVDSFDTHASIPQHFEAVDAAARESGQVGIISVGWDPGLFSLNRLLGGGCCRRQGLHLLG